MPWPSNVAVGVPPGELVGDPGGDDLALRVGEDAGLGQRHARGQGDRGHVADRVHAREAGLEGRRIDLDPCPGFREAGSP